LVLQHYETMAAKSREMLAAARDEHWDEVVRLETDCAAIVAELRRHTENVRLTETERKRKMELIRGMLADDAEIRDLAQPWLAKLADMINATAGQRKVSRAYG
jgi:flagellar protein FliT